MSWKLTHPMAVPLPITVDCRKCPLTALLCFRETVEETPAAVFFVVIGVKCVMLLILFVVAFLSKKTERLIKEDEKETTQEDWPAQEKMLKKVAPTTETVQDNASSDNTSDKTSA